MTTSNQWYRKINSYANPSMMNDVPREWTERMIKAAQKEAATEFFKWHWKNYSSHPNEEEVEERYEVFLNSLTQI